MPPSESYHCTWVSLLGTGRVAVVVASSPDAGATGLFLEAEQAGVGVGRVR